MTPPVSAAFYLIGTPAHEQRLRETGLIGFEALLDSTLVGEGIKLATARARPRCGVCPLSVGEQPLCQPRPALERPLEPLDLEQVDAHLHSTVTVLARFRG